MPFDGPWAQEGTAGTRPPSGCATGLHRRDAQRRPLLGEGHDVRVHLALHLHRVPRPDDLGVAAEQLVDGAVVGDEQHGAVLHTGRDLAASADRVAATA